jgi:hypothetical protein
MKITAMVNRAVERALAAGMTVDKILDDTGQPAKGSLPEIFAQVAKGKKFYTTNALRLRVQDDPWRRR